MGKYAEQGLIPAKRTPVWRVLSGSWIPPRLWLQRLAWIVFGQD